MRESKREMKPNAYCIFSVFDLKRGLMETNMIISLEQQSKILTEMFGQGKDIKTLSSDVIGEHILAFFMGKAGEDFDTFVVFNQNPIIERKL